MNIKYIIGTVCTGLAVISFNASAATSFSFTGMFSADDDVQLFDFTINASSEIALRSFGYAGGTQADGTVVSAGGFDPILALYDSMGLRIATNDDDESGLDPDTGLILDEALFVVAKDPVTGYFWDTYLKSALLAAGNYTVAVMQYDNRPVGSTLAEGFKYDDPFFTSTVLRGCTDTQFTQFCDSSGDHRTNEWAFDILNVESAAPVVVPVPAAAWLLGSGLIGLIGFARRKA